MGERFITVNGSNDVTVQVDPTADRTIYLPDASGTLAMVSAIPAGIAAGTQTGSTGTILFSNANSFTFGMSNSSIITASFSQSNQAFSAGAASSSFQTLSFQDSNGVSFSNNAGAIRVTHDLQFTSNTSAITSNALNTSASRVINILAATNSTGGGTASLSSNVSFSNANNFTFYTSAGNAIIASYSQSVDTGKAGTGFTSAGNNIGLSGTLNTNGLSLSATVAAQTNQTIGLFGSSQTTGSASNGTYDARSISIIGAGIVSVGNHSTSVGGTTTGFIISATQSNQAFSAAGGASAFQTLSFGDTNQVSWTNTNGSIGVASIKLSMFAVSNTTQSTVGTANHTALSFGGAGIASVGITGGSVVISVPAGAGQTGISGIVASNTTYTSGSVTFRDGNGISWASTTGQQISITHDLQFTSATSAITSNALNTSASRVINIIAATNSTAGGAASLSSNVSFSATNGVTFYTSAGGAIVGSVVTSYRASNDAIGLNTAQTNVTWTVNSSGISLNAGGYAGTGFTSAGANISLSGTLNTAGLSLSASVAAPGAAAENNNHNLLGANTAGNTTASGSTIGLSGINITLSGTNNSVINISAPGTSSLSGTGQVSISVNGSTISIGVPNPYVSSYQNVPLLANSAALTWNGASVSHADAFDVPTQISFAFMRIPALFTTNSTTLATIASATASAQGGLFSTVNAVVYSLGTGASSKSLQSVTSGSTGFSFTQKISVTNSTQGSYSLGYTGWAETALTSLSTQYSVSNTNYSFTTNAFTDFTSGRFLDIPFSGSLSAGPYWIVIGYSSSSSTAGNANLTNLTNCNVRYSAHYGMSQFTIPLGIMGSSNLTSGGLMGAASFSTAGGGTTNSINISAMSSMTAMPYFQLLRSA